MDHDLQDLERRSGDDLGAAAKLLRARVRAGQLPLQRLELAAYLGSPLAAWVLGGAAPKPEPAAYPAHGVALGLKPYGPQAYLRAALALLLLLPFRDRVESSVSDEVAAVRAWLACPCAEHDVELKQTRHFRLGSGAVACTLNLAVAARARLRPALRRKTDKRVRAAIAEVVVPWALGQGDPVQEDLVRRLGVITDLDGLIARESAENPTPPVVWHCARRG